MHVGVRACVQVATHTYCSAGLFSPGKTFIDISSAACHYSSAMKHIQTNTHVMLRHLVLPDTDECVCVGVLRTVITLNSSHFFDELCVERVVGLNGGGSLRLTEGNTFK